ncbi:SIR2 family protein [Paenibacillus polymyxa]|uniref:SIR2 family protein n=1 Tax=Paenibacillus polymyxa TaxID=1406 RepID=UPI002AB3996D|nr:SIR2 family protein [Paenibacillus polymyxa]MDY8047100.1 SIR2 family protein [Paenibacillus polymyxa]
MESKKLFDKLLEESNPRKSYAMLEAMILRVLGEYLSSQGKELITNHIINSKDGLIDEFDAYAPEGFDSYVGGTIIEIKLYKNKNSLIKMFRDKMIERIVNRFINSPLKIKNIIFIISLEISNEDKIELTRDFSNRFQTVNIHIWDLNDLGTIFNMFPKIVLDTYENISELLLNTTISDSVQKNSSDWLIKRKDHIKTLKNKFYDDDLVLFLGAGVSMAAKIPTWDDLVSDLLVSLISNKLENYNVSLSEEEKEIIVSYLKQFNGNSPLLLARYIRSGLQDEFIELLTKILYRNCVNSSDVLKEISQLCQPIRNGIGIQGVVTYNFDDLIEYNFKQYRIKHKSIYREADIPSSDELGIYHVHGFLPRSPVDYDNLSKGLLVFSEEGYHNLMLDPYNWSNLIQLTYLKEHTCLMIGLSITDPNLRRLLDIAMRKQEDAVCRHYVILRRESFFTKAQNSNNQNINYESIKKFDMANQDLQEEYYKELGLNVIWVESYEEIPSLLQQIRE